jgi:hypothetical protein
VEGFINVERHKLKSKEITLPISYQTNIICAWKSKTWVKIFCTSSSNSINNCQNA